MIFNLCIMVVKHPVNGNSTFSLKCHILRFIKVCHRLDPNKHSILKKCTLQLECKNGFLDFGSLKDLFQNCQNINIVMCFVIQVILLEMILLIFYCLPKSIRVILNLKHLKTLNSNRTNRLFLERFIVSMVYMCIFLKILRLELIKCININ